MGGEPDPRPHPEPLLEQMQSIGWVVLAERTGRELVLERRPNRGTLRRCSARFPPTNSWRSRSRAS